MSETYNKPPVRPSNTLQAVFKNETGKDLAVDDNQCYQTLNREATRFAATQFKSISMCDDLLIEKLDIYDLINFIHG